MNSLRLILSELRYFAPVWVFASLNILLGTWVLYIPNVKARLDLSDGELGIALFIYALGILSVIPFIAEFNKRIGVGKNTIIGIVFFALAFLLPFWTSKYLLLCISLFVVGLFSGLTDISVNALVSEIERKDQVNIMSSAHGFFSLGGVIGAGIGSTLLLGLVSAKVHIIIVALFIIITNLFLFRNYFQIRETIVNSNSQKSKLSSFTPLIIIAFIAFSIMGSEGAIEHWSKLYLLDVLEISSEKLAGYGFIFFSATMTLGRFFGDGISAKYGSEEVIIGGCLVAILSYSAILSSSVPVVLFGFALLGLGLSVIIPELFRLAGQVEGISPSSGISFVSGLGFVGFLLGPVLMGFISDSYSLRHSFMMLLGVVVVATVLGLLRKFMLKKA